MISPFLIPFLPAQVCLFEASEKEYSGIEYQYVSVESGSHTLELLLDTGEPTFWVNQETYDVIGFDLVKSGALKVAPEFDDANYEDVDYTRLEALSLHQTDDAGCSVTPIKGGVLDHDGVSRLELNGAISPSQFAWGGCILYDLQNRRIIKMSHPKTDLCPIKYEDKRPFVVGHDYRGTVTTATGISKSALFDTGLGRTIFHSSFFEGEDVKLTALNGTVTSHDGTRDLFEADLLMVTLKAGDQTITIEKPLVTQERLPSGMDVSIGMDILRSSKIIVGRSNPPEIYFSQ